MPNIAASKEQATVLENFTINGKEHGKLVYNPLIINSIKEITEKINTQQQVSSHAITKETINIGAKSWSIDVSQATKLDAHRSKITLILPSIDMDGIATINGIATANNTISLNNMPYDQLLVRLIIELDKRNYSEHTITNFVNMIGKYANQQGFLNAGQFGLCEPIFQSNMHAMFATNRPPFVIDLTEFNDKSPIVHLEEKFIINKIFPIEEHAPDIDEKSSSAAIGKLKSSIIGENFNPQNLSIEVLNPVEIKKIIPSLGWLTIDANNTDNTDNAKIVLYKNAVTGTLNDHNDHILKQSESKSIMSLANKVVNKVLSKFKNMYNYMATILGRKNFNTDKEKKSSLETKEDKSFSSVNAVNNKNHTDIPTKKASAITSVYGADKTSNIKQNTDANNTKTTNNNINKNK